MGVTVAWEKDTIGVAGAGMEKHIDGDNPLDLGRSTKPITTHDTKNLPGTMERNRKSQEQTENCHWVPYFGDKVGVTVNPSFDAWCNTQLEIGDLSMVRLDKLDLARWLQGRWSNMCISD